MNYLAIDYGSKRIGLAVAIKGIISPILPLKNDKNLFNNLRRLVRDYEIDQIYLGLSEGEVAAQTRKFGDKLATMLKLKVEFIEEAVSTIEADQIYINNKRPKKEYKSWIDSIAAAVILRRAI
ncbi:MAG TPA: Holliday junction resolvase RuvX [Candidatus Woesebacteria bacterium]|nr:Holliday junction resolvase RuvX [Candidatus Woesebacteria bacterium]HRT39828.1 Holliday junction resolvase RuvX [Candidatus Woesebacteria bacterium]